MEFKEKFMDIVNPDPNYVTYEYDEFLLLVEYYILKACYEYGNYKPLKLFFDFCEVYDILYDEIKNVYTAEAQKFLEDYGIEILQSIIDEPFDLLDNFEKKLQKEYLLDIFDYVEFFVDWAFFDLFDEIPSIDAIRKYEYWV